MLEKLRSALLKKSIRRVLGEQRRARKAHNLDSARSIAVLFDATQSKHKDETLEFVRKIEQKGKKVQLLGYFNTKQAPTDPGFPSFSQKQTDWIGVPKPEALGSLAQEKTDLLLCLNPEDNATLAWVAARAQAAMKIGFVTELPNDLDLALEIPADKGVRFFTEQLHLYLEKIVLDQP
jgi:hypothetical protein